MHQQHRYVQSLRTLGARLLAPERFLSRFSRITSSGKYIAELEGLRFISIGSVILYHLAINLSIKAPARYTIPEQGNWLATALRYDFHGPELFFVISGFILAYPFASHYLKGTRRVNLKQYFLRRLTRLEPPYIVCLLFCFGLLVLMSHQDAGALFPHLAASLLYLHNLAYGERSLINVVAWSLEVEVQFYIIVPFLASIFTIRDAVRRRALIVAICLAATTCQWLFIGPDHRLYLTICNFIQFFLLGFLLADVYLMDWHEQPTRHLRWDIVSLIGWPVLVATWSLSEVSQLLPFSDQWPAMQAFGFPVCTFVLYCAAFRGVLTNRVLTNLWITTIGGMCYTIYLFHNKLTGIVIEATKGLAPTGSYTINLFIQGLIVVPVVLAMCAVYFLVIERPCMRRDWPQRLAGRVQSLLARQPDKVAFPATE